MLSMHKQAFLTQMRVSYHLDNGVELGNGNTLHSMIMRGQIMDTNVLGSSSIWTCRIYNLEYCIFV